VTGEPTPVVPEAIVIAPIVPPPVSYSIVKEQNSKSAGRADEFFTLRLSFPFPNNTVYEGSAKCEIVGGAIYLVASATLPDITEHRLPSNNQLYLF
jgi:hypothetical protein